MNIKMMNTNNKKNNSIDKKTILIITVCIIGLLCIIIWNLPEFRARRQLHLAKRAFIEMDWTQAVDSCEKAIQICPQSVEIYAGLSEMFISIADITLETNEDNEESKELAFFENVLNIIEKGKEINDAVKINNQILIAERKMEELRAHFTKQSKVKEQEFVLDKWVLVKENITHPSTDEATHYEYEYDADGKMIQKANKEDSSKTLYEYDSNDILVRETDIYSNGDEYLTDYMYDLHGNLIKKIERDYEGNDLFYYEYEYNLDGKLILEKDIEGGRTEYKYDEKGNLKKSIYYFGVGDNECIRETDYDLYGNMIREFQYMVGSDAWNVETKYENEYDDFNNLTSIKQLDATGETTCITEYEYQRIHLLSTKNSEEKDNEARSSVNEAKLELSKVTMCSEDNTVFRYTEFNYDSYGRKITETDYDSNGTVLSITTFNYDRLGNMENTVEQNSDGKPVIVREYEYNESGMRTKESVQNFTVNTTGYTYYYYQSGRLIKEENFGANDFILNIVVYEYDNEGKLKKRELFGPNGVSGEALDCEEYEYDQNGNEIKMIQYLPYGVLGQYKISEYDVANRIIKATLYNDDDSVAAIYNYEYAICETLK